MPRPPSIAVDVMTSERGVNAVTTAVCAAAKRCPHVRFHLTGDRLIIEESLESMHRLSWRSLNIEIHQADSVIQPQDDPVWALRHRQESSTHLALKLVRQGICDAAVSCANTGALAAFSRYCLKRISGVDKLAMVCSFPTSRKDRDVYVCDVGASFDSESKHLHDYARMMTAMLQTDSVRESPRVALLNTGTELSKGNAVVRETSLLLNNDNQINYVGYLEGHDIFSGQADVIICDGFVGNCLLKTSEGTANYVMSTIKQACMKSFFTKVTGRILKNIIKNDAPSLNPSLRNGALILGLNGVVIKSHGNADILGIETAILTAIKASTSAYARQLVPQYSNSRPTEEVPA